MLLLLFLGYGLGAHAGGIDPLAFESEAEQEAFRAVIAELRCPKCQNQSVADSDAPIAQDIRQKVYEKMKAGQTQDEIVDFMVARYGDFVTYRPPFRASTALLWLGPPLLVICILAALFWRASRRAGNAVGEVDETAVNQLLAAYGDDQDQEGANS
jgi:cytochrome c-type biogenesis protein CcmH